MPGANATVPVSLLLAGRRCLVVGGGEVASRKVAALLAGGADVLVVAPTATSTIRELAETGGHVTWRRARFAEADLDGVRLVISATGVRAVDEAVSAAAERRNLFVNSADDPANCSFYLTGVVRRDPVVVSVSTSGVSPALASFLRRRLDATLEQRLGDLARLLGDARDALHTAGSSTLAVDWTSIVDEELVCLVESGRLDEAREAIRTALS